MKNPFTTFFNRFKNLKARVSTWKEFGGFRSIFSPFSGDIYQSDIIRSCIRPLAEQTSKANPICTNKGIERILKYSPNIYMNGKDFLYKVRTMYETMNTVFIVVMREGMTVTGFYPIPYSAFEAVEYNGDLYINFKTVGGDTYLFAWSDLIVMRKDYNQHDIAGESNDAILDTLDMINTSNQSIANAVKSTANLRGIVKSTKAMVDPEDLKKMKANFVADYMNIANEGGVAALDSTMEFMPINMSPQVTNWATMKEFRENVFRYFGVNDDIIMSKATPDQMQSFYESRIEPFLIALSLEMTRKVFTDRELGFGNEIMFESSTIQFMSTNDKLALQAVVDRGAMTPNEWREALNLPPIEGGDKPIRRLDTAPVDDSTTVNDDGDDGKEDNNDE